MAAGLFKWLSGPILSLFTAFPPAAGVHGGIAAAGGHSAAVTHPLYVSITEINHNAKDKILEVSCKIFTNDFESVLEKATGARVDLSSAKDKPGADKLIAGYVERHLRLTVDGRPVQLQYVGSENEQDGTWSYFQVNNVTAVKRIDAVDDLLYDGFPSEINILHVTVGGQRQSTRLDCPASAASFQF
ncbi:MAG TPA: DUF6702 family protein [Puia sp.]|nr:DUF6702 family protein [Puia sp.]